MLEVFVLLIAFQIKHFLADYPLQTPYMLGKFKPGWDFLEPLAAHAGVHAAMTALICWVVNPSLMWLALVDFAIHFMMDRIKAGPKYLGRFKALSGKEMLNILSYKDTIGLDKFKPQLVSNVFFWWSLGLDQMIHHLTHYFIVYMIVT